MSYFNIQSLDGGSYGDIDNNGNGYSVIDGDITTDSITIFNTLINNTGLFITSQQLGYLNSISSNVQTQLNTLSASIASINLSAIFGNSNIWTGTNAYNTNLPTSTLTPTTSTQLTTKSYVDSVSGTGLLSLTNIWSGTTNTFSNAVVHNGLTTFTGNISANATTITPTILSYISTLSSNVQTQISNINTSALLSLTNTWSGTTNTFSNAVNLNGLTTFTGNISANATTITPAQLAFVSGATSNLQTQITSVNTNLTTNYLPKTGSNTWTGALNQFTQQVLIGGTLTINGNITCNAINTVSPFQLGCLQGTTSNLQTQLNSLSTSISSINTSALLTLTNTWTGTTNTFSNAVVNNGLTTFVGNISANSTTITPTILSYISTLSSNVQTQINALPSTAGNNNFTGANNFAGINNFNNNVIFNSTNGISLESFTPISISSSLQTSPFNNNSMTINLPQYYNGVIYISVPLYAFFDFSTNFTACVYTQTFQSPSATMTMNGSAFSVFTNVSNNSFPLSKSFNIPTGMGAKQSCIQYVSSNYYNITISSSDTPNVNNNPLVITFTSAFSHSSNTGYIPPNYGPNFMNSAISLQTIVGGITCNSSAGANYVSYKINEYFNPNTQAPLYCGGIFNSGSLLSSHNWTNIGNIVNTFQNIVLPSNGVYILLITNDAKKNTNFFDNPASMGVFMCCVSSFNSVGTINQLLASPSYIWNISATYNTIVVKNNCVGLGNIWYWNYLKLY